MKLLFLLLQLFFYSTISFLFAQQPLETETSRLPKAKTFEIESSFEFQTSSDGIEKAIPFAFIYGITNRIELMVEPVPYVSLNPKKGLNANGRGDIEVTLSYLFFNETKNIPALSVAGEIKIPTARNNLIGTKENMIMADI